MVRGNCDYLFLQPIYNKSQRDTLYDLEAGFMEKKDFYTLMDQVIVRENLPGNTAATPKKRVSIMVCADFEDAAVPEEKFYQWTPVCLDDLPPFRLCHPKYWEDDLRCDDIFKSGKPAKITALEVQDAKAALGALYK